MTWLVPTLTWSQQMATPILAYLVAHTLKPVSPGVK
jgi:hypothetical protein